MITSIIFSKDRPLQLDLTLYTLKKYFPQCNNVVIIYKASEPIYYKSYLVLQKEYKDFVFHNETEFFFKHCLDAIMFYLNTEFVCLLTDDIIFFDNVVTTEYILKSMFHDCQLSCISLRLGVNTNMRDYDGSGILRPDHVPSDISRFGKTHFIWNRTSIPIGGYWSSPLCVDGHIFRRDDLWNIWSTIFGWPESKMGIKNPNSLESYMHRFFFEMPTLMACENTSKIVNSPNNRVQKFYQNAYGQKYNYDPKYLNNLFLEGKRIRNLDISYNKVMCPHQEFNILEGLV